MYGTVRGTPIHVRVSLRGSNTYTNLTESIRKTAKQKTDDYVARCLTIPGSL